MFNLPFLGAPQEQANADSRTQTKSTAGAISPDTLESLRTQGISDDNIANYMGSSSQGFNQNLAKIREGSGGDPRAVSAYLNYRFYGDANYSPTAKKEDKSIWSLPLRAIDDAYTNWKNANLALEQDRQTRVDREGQSTGLLDTISAKGHAIAGGLGHTLSALASPATGILKALSETNPPDPIGAAYGQKTGSFSDVTKEATGQVMNTDFGKEVVQPALQTYAEKSKTNPDLQDVNALSKGLLDFAAIPAVGALPSTVTRTGNVIENIGKNVPGMQTIAGFVAPSPAAVNPSMVISSLTKKGVDPRTANLVGKATPEDAHLMLDTMEKYDATKTDGLAANPAEVPGATAIMRVRHLKQINETAGQMLGNVTKSVAEEPVNLQQTYDNFMASLADKHVFENADGKLFSDTGSIPQSDISYFQQIKDRIDPTEGSIETFGDADLTRKWIFQESNLAKARNAGYSGAAEQIAGQVHSNMLREMSLDFPQYYFPSKVYAETKDALDTFAQFMGKGSAEELTDRILRAGELARRLSSNASANPQDLFNLIDETARTYGFDSATNIDVQNKFVQMLSPYYPTYAQTSLQGSAESAGQALGIAKDIATNNVLGLATKGLQKVLGHSEQAQLDAIRTALQGIASGDLNAAMSPEEAQALLQEMTANAPIPSVRQLGTAPQTEPLPTQGGGGDISGIGSPDQQPPGESTGGGSPLIPVSPESKTGLPSSDTLTPSNSNVNSLEAAIENARHSYANGEISKARMNDLIAQYQEENLTPEELATGIIGGGDVPLPNASPVTNPEIVSAAQLLKTTPEELVKVVKAAGQNLDSIASALDKNFPAYGKLITEEMQTIDAGGDLPLTGTAGDLRDSLRRAVFDTPLPPTQ